MGIVTGSVVWAVALAVPLAAESPASRPHHAPENLDAIVEQWQQRPAPAQREARIGAALAVGSESGAAPGSLTESRGAGDSWLQIGAGIAGNGTTYANRSGRMRQLAYAYDHTQGRWTLYAGSSGGGLWKQYWIFTTPLWTPISDSLPGSPSVGAFLVDPANSARILIGSGDYSRYPGSGLFRTHDGGASWQKIALPDPQPSAFFKVAMSGGNSDTVLAATDVGIFRSITRGESWTFVGSGRITDLVQHATNPSIWYAGLWGLGVVKSINSGQLFHAPGVFGCDQLPALPAGEGYGRISLAAGGSGEADYVYALAHRTVPAGHTYGGTYRSADAGCHWTEIDPDYPPTDWPGGGQGFHTGAIAVDPDDADRVFIGMQAMTFTEAATQSASPCWTRPTGYGTACTQCGRPCPGRFGDLGPDFHQILFPPEVVAPGSTKVLLANDGGYFEYDYTTGAVTSTGNLGLSLAQAFSASGSLAASYSDETLLLSGLFDNGVVEIDTDAEPEVSILRSADGGQVSFAPGNSDRRYYSAGIPFARFLTLDGGTTQPSVNCGLGSELNSTVLHDPTPAIGATIATYSGTAFAGGARVWTKSATDADCSPGWVAANPTPFFAGFDPRLVDQNNNIGDWVFYVSAWAKSELCVLDSDDPASSPGSMVPKKRTPPIADRVENVGGALLQSAQTTADRSSLQPNTAYYVTLESRPSQAFVTTNRGLCWREVTGSLAFADTDRQPDFYELVANPSNLAQMFLATDVGVFRTDTGLAAEPFWYRWMDGLPAVLQSRGLELSWDGADTKMLRIHTFGRGFFERDVTGTSAILFADGFETGNSAIWSTAPGSCVAVASTSCS